ncbi:MAG: zinc ribbon domain-containing protein [Clostridia bacterium]|nr:zinc ribbon domain-containing protein [Clostridia bacterium]
MICEKCGKEIPENETLCPYCGEEETVLEQPEEAVALVEDTVAEEPIAGEIPEALPEEPVCSPEEVQTPVSGAVCKKCKKTRNIIGIVALVLAVVLVALSFVKPILVIGEWKSQQTVSTGYTADLQIESVMAFTMSGTLTFTESLLNYEELGYPAEEAVFSNQFSYSFAKGDLLLNAILEEGQQSTQSPMTMYCSVTPGMFSYWQTEGSPRQVFDYNRDGFFYPSMYLWIASAILLILGVLLLTIPGKKREIVVCEEVLEDDEFEHLLAEINEEMEADPEDVSVEEVLEETDTEEITESTEKTEE